MVRFVAELGSNWNANQDRLFRLIDTAKEIGADAIKLQLFRIDKLFAKETLRRRPDLEARRKHELPLEWLPEIRAKCDDLGLELGITPCDTQAVTQSRQYVDFLKVGSYSLLHHALIQEVWAVPKPVIMSTGMATMKEVEAALRAIPPGNAWRDLTLMHTVSNYSGANRHWNLPRIGWLRSRFGYSVGYSDHSVSAQVIEDAVLDYGAEVVEFHFDLDDRLGSETGHSWPPSQAKPMIERVRSLAVPVDSEERAWRADSDGLRPLRGIR